MFTTADLDPDSVHQIGLREVDRITKEMWAILKSEGYTDTTGSIGAVMNKINQEPRFLFPNTPEGKTAVLKEFKRIIDVADKYMSAAFDLRPKASVSVAAVPAFMEKGAPMGRYDRQRLYGK